MVRATYSSVILVDRPHGRSVRAERPRLQRNGRNGPALELLVLHHGLQPRRHRRCRENVPAVVVVSTDVEGLADELGTQDAVGSLEVHVNPVAGAVPEIRGHVRSQREVGNDAVGRAGDAQDRGVGVRGHVLPVAVEDTGREGGEPAHGVVRHDPDVPLRRQGVHDEGAVRGLDLRQRGDELAGERGLELADLNAERLLRVHRMYASWSETLALLPALPVRNSPCTRQLTSPATLPAALSRARLMDPVRPTSS